MAVAKQRGREKPVKIEQRKARGLSEDLRQNKQHSWLALFTKGRPGGGKTYKKRSQRVGGLSCACAHSLSLFLPLSLSLLFASFGSACKSHGQRSLVGCSPWGLEESDTTERLHFHFSFHALEKEMATHSSVLAWRIPGMREPGGLPSMGLHRVGHD